MFYKYPQIGYGWLAFLILFRVQQKSEQKMFKNYFLDIFFKSDLLSVTSRELPFHGAIELVGQIRKKILKNLSLKIKITFEPIDQFQF